MVLCKDIGAYLQRYMNVCMFSFLLLRLEACLAASQYNELMQTPRYKIHLGPIFIISSHSDFLHHIISYMDLFAEKCGTKMFDVRHHQTNFIYLTKFRISMVAITQKFQKVKL